MQTRGEGVKKSENFADVICTCPLSPRVRGRAEREEFGAMYI